MIALFIVYLWTVLRFLRLIVPPNGLIYFTVDYVKKKEEEKETIRQLNQICRFCRLFYILSLLTLFA